MKFWKFLILFIVFLNFISCDLSFLFESKHKKDQATGFQEIIARARPVYYKITFDEYNEDDWLTFKNAQQNWYKLSDTRFTEPARFRSSLISEANLIDNFQAVRGERITLIDGTYTNNKATIENTISRGKTPRVSSYVLGDAITIRLPDINPRNHHVMPPKRVTLSDSETAPREFYFRAKFRVTWRRWQRGFPRGHWVWDQHADESYHMKEKFVLKRIHKDVYSPLNTLVYEEFNFLLSDKASLIHFDHSDLVESYTINGQALIVILADHADLKTPHTGHFFDAIIKAEDGTTRSISFRIDS